MSAERKAMYACLAINAIFWALMLVTWASGGWA